MVIVFTKKKNGTSRKNGPAIININGYKAWHLTTDNLHREDGPAVVRPNGNESYYLNGYYYNKENYYKSLK